MKVDQVISEIDYSEQAEAYVQLTPYQHHFMPFVITALGAIKPIKRGDKYSIDETIENLKNSESVTTLNGIKMNSLNLQYLLRFLYDTPRSKFVKKMLENPYYGSMTPLFLHAQKEHKGIMYEEWHKTDSNIKYALGKFLEPLVKKLAVFPKITQESVKSFRNEYCTDGTIKYRCNWPGVPKPFNYMILQSWICNAQLREEGVMILHPLDWDKVPEVWDIHPENDKLPF